MIPGKNAIKAVSALQAVIVKAREISEEGDPNNVLPALLDRAEYLAGLILEHSDTTSKYRSTLADICELIGNQYPLSIFEID